MNNDGLPDAFQAHDPDDYSDAQPITDVERRFLAEQRAIGRLSKRGNHRPTLAQIMEECKNDPVFADNDEDRPPRNPEK